VKIFEYLDRFEGLAWAPWPNWRNWGWTNDASGWSRISIFWIGPVGFAWSEK